MTSPDRTDDGWSIGVEVVELERIPSSNDLLAIPPAPGPHDRLAGFLSLVVWILLDAALLRGAAGSGPRQPTGRIGDQIGRLPPDVFEAAEAGRAVGLEIGLFQKFRKLSLG